MQYRFGRNLGDLAWSRMVLVSTTEWLTRLPPSAKEDYAGRTLHGTNTRIPFLHCLALYWKCIAASWTAISDKKTLADNEAPPQLGESCLLLFFYLLLSPLYSLFCISRNASHLSFDQMCPDTEALGLLDSWEFLADISFLMTPAVGNAETVATDLFPIFLTHN